MSEARKCDICGKLYEYKDGYSMWCGKNSSEPETKNVLDLCAECRSDWISWLTDITLRVRRGDR